MAIGGAAGAAAGLIGVMMTRGSDVVLQSGSTVEMVLDRDLHFDAAELDFGGTNPGRIAPSAPAAQGRNANPASLPRPRVRR
jgi:type IV secretion system protein VirB10